MREDPFRHRDVVVAHRRAEQPARAGAVVTHVEHRPLGVGPVRLPAQLCGARVRQLQEPQHVALEVRVVEHLDVVGLGTALQQQLGEGVAPLMRRPALLAFSNDADQRRVAAVPRHEIGVGIRAAVEQQARDRDGVVGHRGQRQTREAQVEEGIPAFRSDVPEQIARTPDVGAIGSGGGALCHRGLRVLSKDALDFPQLAAHDGGVQIGARELGMALQEAQRGVLRHHVRGAAADVMVGTGALEKPCDEIGRVAAAAWRPGEQVLEGGPSW